MRLINTSTLRLHEFAGDSPEYAILSHAWGSVEVTYEEFTNGDVNYKPGYIKIQSFCQKAAADGWQYAWIDTCCINKASSAELTEAINSMFAWYQNAGTCFVYLDDVPQSTTHNDWLPFFVRSRWFTRGWTLQELLAPAVVTFLNKQWEDIGTKQSLKRTIESITGIVNLDMYEYASIAQIFSWASIRETTREEDKAYCLLGLVHVNMPLLYGEGRKAFDRLQLEILAHSFDDSIFAWEHLGPSLRSGGKQGERLFLGCTSNASSILAASLVQFRNCQNVERLYDSSFHMPLWSMTNCGLSATLYGYIEYKPKSRFIKIVIPLNCSSGGSEKLTVTLESDNTVRNLTLALTTTISCTRRDGALGTINTNYCERGTLAPIKVLVRNLAIFSQDTQPACEVLKSLKISCDDGSLGAFGFSPRYCMWHGLPYTGISPQLALTVGEEAFESHTNDGSFLRVRIHNSEQQTLYENTNSGDMRSRTEYYVLDGSVGEPAKWKPRIFAIPLESDLIPPSYLNPILWGDKIGAKAAAPMKLQGNEDIVYGFQSRAGDCFALVIDRNYRVDIIHSQPALDKLVLSLNSNLHLLLSHQGWEAFIVAYKDCTNLKKVKSRISTEIRPNLWISAATKTRYSGEIGCYHSVTIEASDKGPRWYVEQND